MFEDVCKLDVIIQPHEIEYIKNHEVSGVYTFFIKKEPMYVGRSDNIYQRLYSHLKKQSTKTCSIISEVDEIGIQFLNGRHSLYLSYLEMAYIIEFNPPLNEKRNKWILSRHIASKNKKKCKGYFQCGNMIKNCDDEAHENGYCKRHGGNGVTIKMIADIQADKIIKENTQLKLII